MLKPKIYIRIFLYTLFCLCVLSCAKDLGNYEYRELPEPEIGGIKSSITAMNRERLLITPTVSGGLAEEEYTYEWKAVDKNEEHTVSIIGEEKQLDYEVILAPGAYSLYFTLTERVSGIFWQKEADLTVNTSMSEGWMVLCSDEGRASLDFVSSVNGKVYRDVLKDNGMPQMNGARKIHWQRDLSYNDSPYYLFTDEGATRLGKDAFEWKEEYRMVYEMANMPNPTPYSMVSAGFGKMFVSGTDAYYSEVMGIVGLYGSPVNKAFKSSPYIGVNALASMVYAAVYLLYDTDNKRFMTYCPLLTANDLGAQNPLTDPDTMGQIGESFASSGEESVIGNAFDEYPEGYDMVYMENTLYDPGSSSAGITYSVLADGDKRYVYGIQLGDMLYFMQCKFVLGKAYYGDISSCTDITKAEHFAFSSLKNCMYYSVGSTVYSVDLSEKVLRSKVQFTLPGEKISCMKFNLYKTTGKQRDSYDLIVASISGNEGKFRVYEGYDSDGEFTNVKPLVYEGFREIADISYKEKAY